MIAGDTMVVRQLRIRDLPAARDQAVMRQLRIRALPAASDKLATSFIVAVVFVALFWGYQLRQVVTERDYLIRFLLLLFLFFFSLFSIFSLYFLFIFFCFFLSNS